MKTFFSALALFSVAQSAALHDPNSRLINLAQTGARAASEVELEADVEAEQGY